MLNRFRTGYDDVVDALTGNELLLAFFPNFLEPLFLVTVTILAFERVIRHYPDWQERGFAILYRYRWLIGIVIVVYKLQNEWVTHVGNIDRTEFLQQLLGGRKPELPDDG